MKFRKKPVVIEAVRNAGDWSAVVEWLGTLSKPRHSTAGVIRNPDDSLNIETDEGTMRADVGDWVIQGVQGELYPCKDLIFKATYEEAVDHHRVELDFDDGVSMRLVHPASGCVGATQCARCARPLDDEEIEPCYDCENMDPGECWLQGWADNLTAEELLHGKATLPIKAAFDGDTAEFHVRGER